MKVDRYSILAVAVTALHLMTLQVWSIAEASKDWPNEPTGLTVIVDCPFSGSLCPGIWNAYNTEAYATFASAPLSPGSVFDYFMAAGSSTGSGQWGVNLPDAKEVYIGAWWSTNADFVGMCNNTNKMFFIRRPSIDNSFLQWYGPPGTGVARTLGWANQTSYSNAMVSGWSGDPSGLSGGFSPNVGNGNVLPGSGWHRIELYLKTSTTATSRDGIARWWLDGQMVGNVTGLNQSPGGFQEFQINSTWDGSSCLVPPYRDMSKAWHHYYDHIRISIGSGGGISDQPLGPPAAPKIVNIVSQ